MMAQGGGSENANYTGSLYGLFRGYNFSVENMIANRIASRPIHVCRLAAKPLARHLRIFQGVKHKRNAVPDRLKNYYDEGRLEPIEGHLISKLLENPNPFMIKSHLMTTTYFQYAVEGKCYWLLDWDDACPNKWIIWPIPGYWVMPPQNAKSIIDPNALWKVTLPFTGRTIDVQRKFLVPFYFPDPANPIASLSPTVAIRRSIQVDLLAETMIDQGLKNAASPSWAFIVGSTPELKQAGVEQMVLTAEQRKQFTLYLDREYRGAMRSGRPVVLDGLIKDAKRLSMVPPEFGGGEMMRATADRVSELRNVSPISMGRVESTSYAASANTDNHLCINRLNPFSNMFGETLTCYFPPILRENDQDKIVIWQELTGIIDPELEHKKQIDWADRGAYGVLEARQDNNFGEPIPHDFSYVSVGGMPVPVGKHPPTGTEMPSGSPSGHGGDRENEPTEIKSAKRDIFMGVRTAGINGIVQLIESQLLKSDTSDTILAFLNDPNTPAEDSADLVAKELTDGMIPEHLKALLEGVAMKGVRIELKLAERSDGGKALMLDKRGIGELFATAAKAARAAAERLRDAIARGLKAALAGLVMATRLDETQAATVIQREQVQAVAARVAERAASSEVGAAIGGGQDAVREELKTTALVGVIWRNPKDDKSRPAHYRADGQVVKPGEKFYVGGEYARFPHDPTLSPENRYNCRCWTEGVYR
jgi:phage portal protein BeeE